MASQAHFKWQVENDKIRFVKVSFDNDEVYGKTDSGNIIGSQGQMRISATLHFDSAQNPRHLRLILASIVLTHQSSVNNSSRTCKIRPNHRLLSTKLKQGVSIKFEEYKTGYIGKFNWTQISSYRRYPTAPRQPRVRHRRQAVSQARSEGSP